MPLGGWSMDKQEQIDNIKQELNKLYKIFYSKHTPPLIQRKTGCRILALKKQLTDLLN